MLATAALERAVEAPKLELATGTKWKHCTEL